MNRRQPILLAIVALLTLALVGGGAYYLGRTSSQPGRTAGAPPLSASATPPASAGPAATRAPRRLSPSPLASSTSVPPHPIATPAPVGDLFPIVVHDKWGYIDSTGRVVIKPRFDARVCCAYLSNGSAVGVLGTPFTEGLAPVLIGKSWGYIDRTGAVVIPPRFEYARNFSNGLALVMMNDEWGYINTKGAFVVKPQFYAGVAPDGSDAGWNDAADFSEGLASVQLRDGRGYIDRAGRVVIAPRFTDASNFSDGLALASPLGNGNGIGYIDQKGSFVVKPQYATFVLSSFSDGVAIVEKKNGTVGYVTRKGRFVALPHLSRGSFIDYSPSFSEGLMPVNLANGAGYIEKSGRVAIAGAFDSEGDFSEGLAAVEVSPAKWGYIDRSGKMIIKPRFGIAMAFHNGLALVGSFDRQFNISRWGYINRHGTYVWREPSLPAVTTLVLYVDARNHGALSAPLHTQPDKQSPVKMTIPDGAAVTTLATRSLVDQYPHSYSGTGYSGEWYKVTYEGETGFVPAQLLSRYFAGPPSRDIVMTLSTLWQHMADAVAYNAAYRFGTYDLHSGRLSQYGEVNLDQGDVLYDGSGSLIQYDILTHGDGITTTTYVPDNGAWTSYPQKDYHLFDRLALLTYWPVALTGSCEVWTLAGPRVYAGKHVYAITHAKPAGCAGYSADVYQHDTLFIDTTTFLPVAWITSDSETDYTNWGAPISIRLPAVPPGPPPPPTPSPSDSPAQLATGFLQAAMTHNFAAAQQYFAPDKQPRSWADIMGYVNNYAGQGKYDPYTGRTDDQEIPGDVSGCRNVSYITTERNYQAFGVSYASITFTFSANCVLAPRMIDDTLQPVNQFPVNLDNSTGRWYVTSIPGQGYCYKPNAGSC